MSSCAAASVSNSNSCAARAQRRQALEACQFQLHSLPADVCDFDLQDDTWTLHHPGLPSPPLKLTQSLKQRLSHFFPLPELIAMCSGRAALSLLFEFWPNPKRELIHHHLGAESLFHLFELGFSPIDLAPVDLAPDGLELNLDLLEEYLKGNQDQLACVCLELGGAVHGGRGMRLRYLEDLAALLVRYRVPLVFEISHLLDQSLYLLDTGQVPETMTVHEVSALICDLADAVFGSLSGNLAVDRGGVLALRQEQRASVLQQAALLRGTSLAPADERALVHALSDSDRIVEIARKRRAAVAELYTCLQAGGVPLRLPCGGHCFLIDADRIPAAAALPHPAQSLAAALFDATGIRCISYSHVHREVDHLLLLSLPQGLEPAQCAELGRRLLAFFKGLESLPRLEATLDLTHPGFRLVGEFSSQPIEDAALQRLPMTVGQKALYFIQTMDPAATAYNLPCVFRIRQAIDLARLARCVAALPERHAMLRGYVASDANEPILILRPRLELDLKLIDARGQAPESWHGLLRRLDAAPFDLHQDALVRASLLTLADDDYVLMFTLHHLIFDGTSLVLLLDSLRELYHADSEGRALALRDDRPPLAAFGQWQQELLVSPQGEAALAFWLEQLKGELPVLELATDWPRPTQYSGPGAYLFINIPSELLDRAVIGARALQVSLFALLLAVFKLVLWRHSQCRELIVGISSTGRPEPQFEDLVGYFVNMLPLRSRFQPSQRFSAFAQHLRDLIYDAMDHGDLPFLTTVTRLNLARDPSRTPVFQAVFNLFSKVVNTNDSSGGLNLDHDLEVGQTGEFEIMIEPVLGKQPQLKLSYKPELYRRERILRLGEHYLNLLSAALSAPDQAIESLNLHSEAELRHLLEWFNAGPHDPAQWNYGMALERDHEPLRLYVLDRRLQVLPEGAPGQLFIAGVGPAQDDGADPAQIATRFLPNPFASGRIFATARPARLMTDQGSGKLVLEHLGQHDRLTWWKEHLADMPPGLDMPLDKMRPQRLGHEGAALDFELLGTSAALIKAFQVTPFAFHLAALAALLARYSGQDAVTIGLARSQRGQILPLAIRFKRELSFAELLRQVQRSNDAAIAHEEALEQIVASVQAQSHGRSPLFQVLFGCSAGEPIADDADHARYELNFSVAISANGRARASLVYSTELWERRSMLALTRTYQCLFQNLLTEPERPLLDVPLLDPSERRQLLEDWSGTCPDYPRHSNIVAQFERQVAASPDAVALVGEAQSYDYAHCNRLANQYAAQMAELGLGQGDVAAFCLARDCEAVLVILAILKLGACYLPLEASFPERRIRSLCSDSGARFLLTRRSLLKNAPVHATHYLEDWQIHAQPDHNREQDLHPLSPAYVIYTSGSTGVPKGVVVPHRAVLRLVCGTGAPMFGPDQVFLMTGSLAFDASTFEIWGALLHGARLVPLPEGGLEDLGPFLVRQRITVMWLTSQLFNVAVDKDLESMAGLRYVLAGGEALSPPHVMRFRERFPKIGLLNGYGPTENTTFTTLGDVAALGIEPGGVPLGAAIPNTKVYICDAQLRLVPAPMFGELVSGGDGLAQGYLERPALTAEKFVPNPFSITPGARLYRTGDLARWLIAGHDIGVLEYAGRIDRQVKLRGFRIELGEIETVLNALPGIRQALVLARETPGGKQLVAYVAAAAALDTQAVLDQVGARLPAYMVPASLTVLEAFPVNNNGKIDQKRLPQPSFAANKSAQQPLSPSENALAEIWRELLGVPELHASSDFFALGGHSLLAIRLAAALKRSFKRETAMRAVFEHPTLGALAAYLDADPGVANADSADSARKSAVSLCPIGTNWRDGLTELRAPLSFMQQRLWFIDRLEGPTPTYNIPLATWVQGELDVGALELSLNQLVARHEALRTRFVPTSDYPEQLILAGLEFRILLLDLCGLGMTNSQLAEVLAERERWRLFDLERGPLLRLSLLRLEPQRHLLLLNQHHIISDGWSLEILVRELAEGYDAAVQGRTVGLAAPPIQYADYAVWQQGEGRGLIESQRTWWREQLADLPSGLDLPLDKARPQILGYRGASLVFELLGDTSALIRAHRVTPFMLHLAALAALLARYAAQDRVALGTPVANRSPEGVDGLIGFFANTLALPVWFNGQIPFVDLLHQVRNMALEAFARADTPFEKVVEALQPDRSLGRSPLFQVLFSCVEALPTMTRLFPGLKLEDLAAEQTLAKFELDFFVVHGNDSGRAAVTLVYNTELWGQASMVALTRSYQRLFQNLLAEPHCPLSQVSLLDPSERQQLLEQWSGRAPDYPRDSTIVALFERQVAIAPGAIALVSEGQSFDYATCNRRANQYAARLAELGLRPGDVAAFCLARGSEAVLLILAILKRGACYLPMDANFPLERMRTLCTDSGARFLLTRAKHLPQAPIEATHDLDAWDLSAQPEHNPDLALHPLNPAYVIYTSGSTGVPKGVVVPHRAVVRLVCGTGAPMFNRAETYAMTCSLAFDVSTFEIWGALLSGARLVPLPEGEIEHLGSFLVHQRITVMWLTAQLFNVAVDRDLEAMAGLRFVLAGGEALSPPHVRRFLARYPQITLLNGYGPTENTTFTTCGNVSELGLEPGGVPLGPPIPNTSIYITDAQLRLVPTPLFGELVSGGDGVAQGYLARPALTAEKFVPDPFGQIPGARLYRTGDLARWLIKYQDQSQGVLEYAGRIDRQVKLRGFRIELGEIEAVLNVQAEIRQALVLARETPSGMQLVAYAVADQNLDTTTVLSQMRTCLPAYMVPVSLTVLDAFPVNNSGKLDQKRLPVPHFAESEETNLSLTPTATALAVIWRELLGVDRLGHASDFFALGGHSLLAIRLVSALKRRFNCDIAMKAVFDHSSLGALAEHIETSAEATNTTPALAGDDTDSSTYSRTALIERRAPVSFMQQRLWFIDRLEGPSPTYNIPMALWVQGALCPRSLQQSLNQLIARHETLRTRFVLTADYPEQLVELILQLEIQLLDLSALHPDVRGQQAENLAERERWRLFDLEHGPLLRLCLLRLEPQLHLLVLTQHHIISDGWSMEILMRELAESYGAAVQGRVHCPTPLPIQYADYAIAQQKQGMARLDDQLAWWQEQLSAMPAGLDLPLDKPRPQTLGYQGATLEFELKGASAALIKSHQVTPFMLHLAALAVLLARYSGQDAVTIGTPIANRSPDVEELIGFFANTLALPITFKRQTSFAQLLRQVRAGALEAFVRADTPFEKIVETLQPDRSLGRSPLFQVLFVCGEGMPANLTSFPGLKLNELAAQNILAKFELNFSISHGPESARAALVYNTQLWAQDSMAALTRIYQRLYQNLTAEPDCPLMQISLLDRDERAQLLERWSGQAPEYPRGSTIVAQFERQVAATPTAIALVSDQQSYDYQTCNRLANQYAAHLAELGLLPGDVAAFCLARGCEAVLVILAILKRGACYLPLDANFPSERISTLCADSGARFLLTRKQQVPHAPTGITHYLEGWELSALPDHNPELVLHPLSPAYVIYTSGSTGVPKGVVVPHRAVLRLVCGTGAPMFNSSETYLMTCSLAFDVSTFELWGALLHGARLVPLPEGEIEHLGAFLVRQRITVMWLTAQLFNVAVDKDLESMAGLRYVLAGGEALSLPHVRRFLARFPQISLFNGYGPTENTTFTTCGNVSDLGLEPGGVPLGPPIPNTSIYITDAQLQLLPTPMFGELVSGGDGVAQGYLARPALTAEKFVPDPFGQNPGGRLYRTGDLARWLIKYRDQPEGVLEYAGRIDRQVKLRGFRIELGEIEAALKAEPAIRQSLVLCRETATGKQLVAYAVADRNLDTRAVLSQMRTRLPAYMVPVSLTVLEAFPVNNSGKLDQKRLPVPQFAEEEAANPPLTPTATALAVIWRELLGVEHLRPTSDFFALGGHSLLAIRLVGALKRTFHRDIAMKAVFDHPSLGGLAEHIEASAERSSANPAATDVGADSRSREIKASDQTAPSELRAPLSLMQQRLWFIDRLEGPSPTYNIPLAAWVEGALCPRSLQQSLNQLIARHETLRTRFVPTTDYPEQLIEPSLRLEIQLLDLSALHPDVRGQQAENLAERERWRLFDLEHGPLLRLCLLRLEPQLHLLVLTQHHIISDGWSMEILMRELAVSYGAAVQGRVHCPTPLPIQYADYAIAQQKQGVERLDDQLAWWQEQLSAMPAGLDLPLDKPRPQTLGYQGATLEFELKGASAALIKSHQVTPFMLHLAALAVLLARYSGQDAVTIGTPIANRSPDVEDLIGFFANTLALPVTFKRQTSFAQLLRQVRAGALEAFVRADTPFEKIVETLQPDRSLGRSPLFQVLFVCGEGMPANLTSFPGLKLNELAAQNILAKFELNFSISHGSDSARAALVYNTQLWGHDSMAALTRLYQRLYQNLTAEPDCPLMQISLLDPDERAQLLERWSGQAPEYPRGSTIVAQFERQVAATPTAVALVSDQRCYDYQTCNRLANQYAAHLAELGLLPGDVAAFCLARGCEAVLVILAILKRGACYLPLDANFPSERISTLCADSGARFLLTREQQVPHAPTAMTHYLEGWELSALPDHNPELVLHPLSPAYVIYTSGSTGVPKGVVVPHRAVLRLVCGTAAPMFNCGETYLMTCSLAFDVSTFEIWGALLHGARLVPLPEGEIEHLGAFLVRQRITVMWLTAQLFNVAVDKDLASMAGLRYVLAGGEALSPPHVSRFLARYPQIVLLNGYGPTENTTFTTCGNVSELGLEPGGVPLGPPIPNTSVYVTDAQLRLVPTPMFGELVSGGDGVAQGYLARPALTAEKFVPDPFGMSPGGRLYRTGDLARWLIKYRDQPSGVLEYAGRIDRQVKLRGFRIELGEIEAVLSAQSAIRQALVLARDTPSGKQLVAYVVADQDLDTQAVLNQMRTRLPAYMVPVNLTVLDAFPVNNSGKLDQKRLPAPSFPEQEESDEPLSATATALAEIWHELLGVAQLRASSDFFALGGHSLLAIRLVGALKRKFKLELPMKAIFEYPTLGALAEHLDVSSDSASTGQIQTSWRNRQEELRAPLSLMQQRLWFIDRLEGPSATYNIPLAAWVEGALCVRSLQWSLNQLVERHESLRTRFVFDSESPQQLIMPQLRLRLQLLDLCLLEPSVGVQQAQALAERERWRLFDLERGPLVRLCLLRLEPRRHLLVLNQHHIISDGWSLEIFLRELAEGYAAAIEGRAPRLNTPSLQYSDYAVWQQDQGSVLEPGLAWWQEQLAGMPAGLDLPLDKPRPAMLGYQGETSVFELLGSTAALLKTYQVTPFMLHLAALAALLMRYSGQDSVTVGTPIANRSPEAVEELIGFFANTLALPIRVTGQTSFAELLQQVRGNALEAFARADSPFEKVVEALQPDRSLGRSPLFQILFTCIEAMPAERINFPGLNLSELPAQQNLAKFELNVSISHQPDAAQVTLIYNAELWEQASMAAMARIYQRMFQCVLAEPQCPLLKVSLLEEGERKQLLEAWSGQATDYPRASNIIALFEAQVAATPSAIALVSDGQCYDYQTCNRRANQYAAHLAELGLVPGDVAAFCLVRGIEAILVILAMLKRGACYLPLDANFPLERIRSLCDDSGARFLLTRKQQLSQAPVAMTHYLDDWDLSGRPDHNPGLALHPLNPAYVIYTSGSTGVPKGVVVPHRAVVRLVCGTGAPMFNSSETYLMTCSLAFDVSTFEIWGALLSGARLVPLPEGGIEHLGAFLVAQRITVMWLTAQLFNVAVDKDLESMAGLRYVLAGGEALSPPHVRRFLARYPQIVLLNGYGPTENTTFTTCGNVSELGVEAGGAPLGPPIPNTTVYITDAQLRLVPSPMFGELVSGGDGVAQGYLARPALTAEKFVPDAFGQTPGARLYRTGDLARWLIKYQDQPAGVLEYAGRIDRQVKVRGFRIELGEIEAVLGAQPGMRQALVLARETPSGKQLVAYAVADQSLDAGAVLSQMRTHLPAYMVPVSLTLLETFPVNNSGKLDQKRLPAPSFVASSEEHEPLSANASLLAQIWTELLGVDQLGPASNFFALGGHSLLALKLTDRIKGRFGVVLPLASFFAYPSLEAMTRQIEASLKGEATPTSTAVSLDAHGSHQALFLVHPIGGQVFHYRQLAQLLDRPVYGLQAAGHLGEKAQDNVSEQASRYLRDLRNLQANGPYLLAAWSYGGLVAHEMARQLQVAGEQVNGLVLIDSHLSIIGLKPDQSQLYWAAATDLARTHGTELDLDQADLANLEEGAAISLIMDRLHQAKVLTDLGQDQLQQFLAVYRANAHAASTHKPGLIAVETLLLQPKQGEGDLNEQAAQLWQAQLETKLKRQSMEGDHFTCFAPKHLTSLAEQIETFLKSSSAKKG